MDCLNIFRSAALRRAMYVLAALLALVRFATRSHSEEPFSLDEPAPPAVHRLG
jgi:hypothetical protein